MAPVYGLSPLLFQQLVQNLAEGVWFLDQDANTVYANASLAGFLGVSAEELRGRSFFDFVADENGVRQALENREANSSRDLEVRFLRSAMRARVSFAPLFDDAGAWHGSSCVVHDLHSHMERAFLDSLIENIPNMVFVKDAKELRFVRFNKAGEDLLGYPRTALIGKNDYDFFTKDQAEFFINKDRSVLAGREIVDIPEEPISTRDKGQRILHTKKIPLLGPDGKPEYLLGIAEDITEQKRAEQQRLRVEREQAGAAERERASREFLTIASHELKTPVTSLKLQLQMAARSLTLNDQAPSVEKLAKVFDTSIKQVDRLTRLIEDLLDVSRIQSGKISFQLEDVDLSSLLHDVLLHYRDPLEVAGCELRTFIQPAVRAMIDRGRFEQVIVNLISNVLKYAPGAPVTVSMQASGDEGVRIEVADSGPGIHGPDQKRIFERFGRLVSSRNISGLGLGLFISQQIVEAHGGEIRVESHPGSGAKFIILLPQRLTRPAVMDKFTYTAEASPK